MPTVYEIVTEQIIESLKAGVAPWRKPWRTEAPANLVSQNEYRGINVFILAAQQRSSRYWLTFNQLSMLGGTVKPHQRATTITFWKRNEYTRVVNGEEEERTGMLLRYFKVFSVDQVNGLESLGLGETGERVPDIEAAEKIVASMPNRPTLSKAANAFYRPAVDTVFMPDRQAFNGAPEYYSTLFHELTHATGHKSRLGRDGIENLKPFGTESYSREELIAEMGAAMLCGVTGIAGTIEHSASYLDNWIRVLKGDSRLIVQAASAAQKAADCIRGIAPTATMPGSVRAAA